MPSERVFWPVLAAVALAHFAFLTQWRFAQAAATPRQHDPQAAPVVFRVRPAPVDPPAAVAPPPAPLVPSASPPAPERSRPEPAPALPPPSVVAIAPPAAEAPYLPRAELSVPPRVESAVDVLFPEDVQGVVDLRVQATLFVDETGKVRRVRVDTADVHPSFERAIFEAFAQAQFTPGEVDGQPARSQMRVEIEFHAPGNSLVR